MKKLLSILFFAALTASAIVNNPQTLTVNPGTSNVNPKIPFNFVQPIVVSSNLAITYGNQVAGYVLQNDGTGNASWQSLGAGTFSGYFDFFHATNGNVSATNTVTGNAVTMDFLSTLPAIKFLDTGTVRDIWFDSADGFHFDDDVNVPNLIATTDVSANQVSGVFVVASTSVQTPSIIVNGGGGDAVLFPTTQNGVVTNLTKSLFQSNVVFRGGMSGDGSGLSNLNVGVRGFTNVVDAGGGTSFIFSTGNRVWTNKTIAGLGDMIVSDNGLGLLGVTNSANYSTNFQSIGTGSNLFLAYGNHTLSNKTLGAAGGLVLIDDGNGTLIFSNSVAATNPTNFFDFLSATNLAVRNTFSNAGNSFLLGNVTIGMNIVNTVTLNGGSVSIPNGVNFGSGVLVLNPTANTSNTIGLASQTTYYPGRVFVSNYLFLVQGSQASPSIISGLTTNSPSSAINLFDNGNSAMEILTTSKILFQYGAGTFASRKIRYDIEQAFFGFFPSSNSNQSFRVHDTNTNMVFNIDTVSNKVDIPQGNISTNVAPLGIITTNPPAINAQTTNGNFRSWINAPVVGNNSGVGTAACALYVITSDLTTTNVQGYSAESGTDPDHVHTINAIISPNSIFIFSNLSTGSGTIALTNFGFVRKQL